MDKSWWHDSKLVNDIERDRFLYQVFMEYYSIIINGDIKQTEVKGNNELTFRNRFTLINICKNQLDIELKRVERREYEREYED